MNSDEVITSGPLTLNLSGFSLTINDVDVPLTQAEFLLMATLARNPYNVIDRQTLARVLRTGALGPAMTTSPRAVDTHIARLRHKLAEAGCECIRTMRNVGYRFVPPTSSSPRSEAERPVPPPPGHGS
jgi:DNA-binding response OmpR family regulator